MNKLIFVCTGNTCRSPLCESYMKTKYPEAHINSRGLFVSADDTSEKSQAIIEKNNLILPGKPSPLTEDDLTDALLLVMGAHQKEMILSVNPQANVHLLSEYATGEQVDVEDPFGGTVAQYEKVFEQLKSYLDKIEL